VINIYESIIDDTRTRVSAPKGAERDGKRRGDRGHQGQQVDQPLKGDIAADDRIGKDEAEDRPARCGQHTHDQGVAKNQSRVGAVVGVEIAAEVFQAEFPGAGIYKAVGRASEERKDHENEKKKAAVQ